MSFEHIVPQSAGSLAVVVLSLIIFIVQILFFLRKPHFRRYLWSAAVSFSSILYATGVFIEYNTPPGTLNRIAGLGEFTAQILLIQCFYGFTFSLFGIKARKYHAVAGVFHFVLLCLLWFSSYIVSHDFITRKFLWFTTPFAEPALGSLGPAFEAYLVMAAIGIIVLWIKYRDLSYRHNALCLVGMIIWLVLGIHDGMVSLGVTSVQYLMEYGFLVFAIIADWGVYGSRIDMSAEDKYRVITEFADDAIMMIQDGKIIFMNPACDKLLGQPLTVRTEADLFAVIAPEDREKAMRYKNILNSPLAFANSLNIRVMTGRGEERCMQIRSTAIQYKDKPATLIIIRNISE